LHRRSEFDRREKAVDELDYEQIVALYHHDLYCFAYSLAGNPDDACELTQESYYRLLSKNGLLRDPTKIKAWLFTTLYRAFLGQKRRSTRFPHMTISSVEHELPALTPEMVNEMDGLLVMEALLEIDEQHRTPLVLFYLQDLSYREIAEILDVPIGTVMSRLSRSKVALRNHLAARAAQHNTSKRVSMNPRHSQSP
jgi:RNA polymerase sigma-70 factor (ECF subfamily)